MQRCEPARAEGSSHQRGDCGVVEPILSEVDLVKVAEEGQRLGDRQPDTIANVGASQIEPVDIFFLVTVGRSSGVE